MTKATTDGVALPDLEALRGLYIAAQLKGNRREALRLIVEAGIQAGATPHEIQREVIEAAQRDIGRLWQENRISVAEEHMATAISNVALAHLYQFAKASPPNGKRVMVACVEGELHDFPARLVADAVDLAGFEVRYLGASVPTDSLIAVLDAEPASQRTDLLAISVTMAFNVPSLRKAISRLRGRAAQRLPIVVGGGACDWSAEMKLALDVDGSGTNARQMVDEARRLLALRPHPEARSIVDGAKARTRSAAMKTGKEEGP